MLSLWEKLELKEKLILVAFYGLSLVLVGLLGYGWGSGRVSPNGGELMANLEVPGQEMAGHVETIELDSSNSVQAQGADTAPAPEAAEVLVVHVSGAVRKSGVYRLPAGSRVADAIERAGGATQKADLDALNLAEPLSDGQKVYVPRKGEVPIAARVASSSAPSSAMGGSGRTASTGARYPININRATANELEALPGIGPALAQRIVEHRRQNGPFQSVDDLMEVRGIGPKKMEAIRPLVTVR